MGDEKKSDEDILAKVENGTLDITRGFADLSDEVLKHVVHTTPCRVAMDAGGDCTCGLRETKRQLEGLSKFARKLLDAE